MKRMHKTVFLFLLAIGTFQVTMGQEDAEAIFKKASAQLLTENMELMMEMNITDHKGRKKEKGFEVLIGKFGDTNKTRVSWQKPERAKGTTVIITKTDNDDGIIEVFTPSNGKTRKMKATPANMKLLGSEFNIGNLSNQKTDQLTYSLLNTEEINGHACYHIQVKPDDSADEAHGELWIETDTYQMVQIAIFDKKGEMASLAKLSDFKKVAGAAKKVQPMRIRTEDFENNKQTDLRILKIQSRTDLKESDFTLKSM